MGELALIDEMRGQWAEAESKARDVLQNLGGYDTTKLVASTLLGRIVVPGVVANIRFGGPRRNRLFIAATTRIYSLTMSTTGLPPLPGR